MRRVGSLEFAIVIFPHCALRNILHNIPMLSEFSFFNSEQIKERDVFAKRHALTEREHKIAVAEDLVNVGVRHRRTILRPLIKRIGEAGNVIAHERIMLNKAIAIKIKR